MAKKVGVWLDCERAHVISVEEGKHMLETLESNIETRVRFEGESKSFSRRGGTLVNPSKKRTKRRKHQLDTYIERVLERIEGTEEVLIFGPAETKLELKKSILKRRRAPVVSLESAERMTQRQMIARVREHFSL